MLFLLREVHSAPEYIQHASVFLEALFQTIQMIQFFRVSPLQICNAVYPYIMQMPLHIGTYSRYLLQVADRLLCPNSISVFTVFRIMDQNMPILKSFGFFTLCCHTLFYLLFPLLFSVLSLYRNLLVGKKHFGTDVSLSFHDTVCGHPKNFRKIFFTRQRYIRIICIRII